MIGWTLHPKTLWSFSTLSNLLQGSSSQSRFINPISESKEWSNNKSLDLKESGMMKKKLTNLRMNKTKRVKHGENHGKNFLKKKTLQLWIVLNWEHTKSKDSNISTLLLNVITKRLLIRFINNAMEISLKVQIFNLISDSFLMTFHLIAPCLKNNAMKCQFLERSRTLLTEPWDIVKCNWLGRTPNSLYLHLWKRKTGVKWQMNNSRKLIGELIWMNKTLRKMKIDKNYS